MIRTEPWHFDVKIPQKLQQSPQNISGHTLTLINGGPGDYQIVNALFQKSPVNHYCIGRIQIINNPALTLQFERKIMALNGRDPSPAFKAHGDQEEDLPIRHRTDQALRIITTQHLSTFLNVQLYPAFYGTQVSHRNRILQKGFTQLDTNKEGFLGTGIYNTQYAKHAHRYSDGTLIFNWVAFHSAYPVTLSDVSKLQGHANDLSYDAHYALLCSKNPHNPKEIIFLPTTGNQNPECDELVVFDPSQILPRYLVTLMPDALNFKTPTIQATGDTLMGAIFSYFPEAPTHLQNLLKNELGCLNYQRTTPLNPSQNSLLALIGRLKGEGDVTIRIKCVNRMIKLLEDTVLSATSLNLKEICTLQGHNDYVSALTQLTDGNIASASYDNTIIIWDPITGDPIQILKGHDDYVSSLTPLANGTLASGSWDTTVIIWDLKTGAPIQRLWGHTERITALTQLQDGTIASASYDNTIIIWDPITGDPIQTLDGHTCFVSTVNQLPDGSLASGSYDTTINIWNLKTRAPIRTLKGHKGYIYAVTPLPNGTLASGSYDKTIIIWDLKTGVPIRTLVGHTHHIYALAPLANGALASGSSDSTIKIWDLKTGICIQTLEGHSSSVEALTQLANGTLASGSQDKTIKIWG